MTMIESLEYLLVLWCVLPMTLDSIVVQTT